MTDSPERRRVRNHPSYDRRLSSSNRTNSSRWRSGDSDARTNTSDEEDTPLRTTYFARDELRAHARATTEHHPTRSQAKRDEEAASTSSSTGRARRTGSRLAADDSQYAYASRTAGSAQRTNRDRYAEHSHRSASGHRYERQSRQTQQDRQNRRSPSGLNPRFFIALATLAALAIIVVFGATRIVSCAQRALTQESSDDQTQTQETVEITEPEPETTDFSPSPSDMDAIPTEETLQTFSLSDLSAPELSEDQISAIEVAISDVTAQGDVGFVFYDVDSGRGLSYDPDADVYGASTFKAPYALYICETLIETGQLSLSDYCPVSYVSDSGSYYGNSGDSSYPVGELIEAAIVSSDNNAFGFLRDSYDYLGFDDWAISLGAEDTTDDDSWFPRYCVRSSAKIWTEMLSYLETESETALWLADLLGQTETSFIRNAIGDADATDITVLDKAGWIADSDPDYNAICDAGIIEADGHTYIMCVMTGMPDSESNRETLQTLVSALFDARETLNLQQ